jgi:cytidylate kinase
MERLRADRKEAERTVAEIDHGRRRYVETYYQHRWDDPTNYHLTLNSDACSFQQCAEMIAVAARVQGWS